MIIRRARDRDRDAIAEIDAACFERVCEPIRWTDALWVACDDGHVVAFAAARVVPRDVVYLSRCGVLPRARGHGVQRRLIRARVRLARLPAVTYTMPGNTASANNLIACGFRLYVPPRAWAGRALYWVRYANSATRAKTFTNT